MGSAAAAAKKNQEFSDKINAALGVVLRDVAVSSISMTLTELVKATWHDSSNAAYNWHVIDSGAPAPAYEYRKGVDPVGKQRDYRSAKNNMTAKTYVAVSVLEREKSKIISNFNLVVPATLQLYNAIENSGEEHYVGNAQIAMAIGSQAVAVTFSKVSAQRFDAWKSKYRF